METPIYQDGKKARSETIRQKTYGGVSEVLPQKLPRSQLRDFLSPLFPHEKFRPENKSQIRKTKRNMAGFQSSILIRELVN